jgi:hypothetical protein
MKTIAFLLLLAAPMLAHATEIHLGDSLADVRSALGAPNGYAQVNNNLTLFYDRGQVQFVDGRVISSDFLSPEDFAAKQARDKAAAAQAAQRMAEGQALKAQKLADPNFTSAPPAYQLAFWLDFRVRYPEVPCDDEYNLALARQQEQLAAQEREQRVAELEARVADAENRATLAENLARQANYNASYASPFFLGGVPRERFREREDEDHDRDRFRERQREHEDKDCDDRGSRARPISSSSLPSNQVTLPVFPIPAVSSLNLPTPNTGVSTNPIPRP